MNKEEWQDFLLICEYHTANGLKVPNWMKKYSFQDAMNELNDIYQRTKGDSIFIAEAKRITKSKERLPIKSMDKSSIGFKTEPIGFLTTNGFLVCSSCIRKNETESIKIESTIYKEELVPPNKNIIFSEFGYKCERCGKTIGYWL